jgi:FKBP-type peptidyl-prolyl cis-trans isomerase
MPPPAPPAPTATPEEIFQTIGWIIAQQSNLAEFGMNETELAAFQRGINAGCNGQPAPQNFEAARAAIQQFLNGRVQANQERQAAGNKIEERDFLAKIDANPAITKTASGLRYEIIQPGTGAKPTPSDTVVAHYTLTFADGTVVESSREGGQPLEFALNGVIRAWTEGLQLIGTGGQMKLYVPSALGYGERGSPGGIPPAKLLVFDVELVAVKPAPVQLPGATPSPSLPLPTP